MTTGNPHPTDDAVTAWHEAVNGRDLNAARTAVSDPVVVHGPRGTGPIDAAGFADWIVRSGIRLDPRRRHLIDDRTVIVEQEATWPEAPDPVRVATVFTVDDGRVSSVLRFPSLDEAREAADAS